MALKMRVVNLLLLLACIFLRTKSTEAKTKKLEMHFYMHDMVNLQDPSKATAILVANPDGNLTTLQPMGSVLVIDDLLTEGPSPSSKGVGRAQGHYVSDSKSSVSILFSFTGVFDNGTLSFHGQDVIPLSVREIAVVGGTGAFRFTTGYALITTSKFIPPFSAILELRVFFTTLQRLGSIRVIDALSDSKASLSVMLSFTGVFHNGTLIFHRHVRKVAVVGGTGAFRFATGYNFTLLSSRSS